MYRACCVLDNRTRIRCGNCLIPLAEGCVEPGVDVHICSSHLLHSKFSDLCECPRGMLLKAHSMDDALVNVGGIFSGHYCADGRTTLFLLTTVFGGSHSAKTKLERKRHCQFIHNVGTSKYYSQETAHTQKQNISVSV